jgi:serine/threonine protein kinase
VLGAYRAVKIVYRKHFKEDRPYEREFEGIRHFDPISRNHPGLVHILHVGRNDTGGYFYYLMELADDCSEIQPLDPAQYQPKTLGGELKRRGRFSLNECVQLGLALTDSVGYLHEHGLVHRDIKPSNIIFVNGQPKLADIGLVTQIGDGLTFVGTEGFFPPEGPGSPVADLYSLGKLLYESLTGLSRQQYPDLPTDIARTEGAARFQRFNKIILRACENNLGKRYASARQVHADLEHLAAKRTSLRLAFKSRAERHTDENKK